MGTLKGQNFRILTFDTTASKFKCIGMATSCTVNHTTQTDESNTKDDVGLASKPTVISQGFNVSVESLNVVDAAAMLTAIKNMTPFTLLWDEVSTANNQSPLNTTVARTGQAYLNDLVLTFNDRENSAKSLQFTGTGQLDTLAEAPAFEAIALGSYTKGQFVRLFLGSDNTATPAAVIASAKQLSLHVSVSLENATTKDTPGTWEVQEPTAISYDISTTALMRGNDTITSAVAGKTVADIETIKEAGTPVKFQIANVSGDNQRTKGAVIVSGSVLVTNLTLNGPNRANADYNATLTGWGSYTVAA